MQGRHRYYHVRRLLLIGVCGLLLYLPLAAAIAAARAAVAVRQVTTTWAAVTQPSDLQALERELERLASALAALRGALDRMSPVLDRLSFVPWIGPTLAAADELADAATRTASLAAEGLRLAAPVLATTPWDPAALTALGNQVSILADDLAQLDAVVSDLAARPLPRALAYRLQQAQATVRPAQAVVEMGPAWGELMGGERRATYLILVQNNHELRATGGFISAVGAATFADGVLADLTFVDSYSIYQEGLAYPLAPAPMRELMGIDLLLLRDANWSPDLPTAARVATTLYQQHTGLAVDGVITVDLDGVRWLLEGFGSLRLPGRETPITPANVEMELAQLWNMPPEEGDWWSQRKDFVGDLTEVARQRLARREVAWGGLAHGLWTGLERRGIQVWLVNPAAQEVLAAHGWDGGLHPEPGADYLALVDTNMGYNKVNAVVSREAAHTVSWPDAGGPGQAVLTITYTHPVQAEDPACRPEPRYGLRYEDMMARCYFDYLRVYAPAGSTLLGTSGMLAATVSSRPGERGTQEFAGYFVLRPNSQHQVSLRYTLPPSLRPQGYRLVVQRQAGTDPLTLSLQVGEASDHLMITEGAASWSPEGTP